MSKWGFLGVFTLGFFAYAGMNVFFKETNTLEFCTSCHTMEQNLIEYKETVHYKNHSGVRATCADCHVPKAPLAKIWTKLYAAKDVYHEIIGTIDTPEKFEKHRWDMANRVWDKMRESDSRECRTCHSWDAMMFSEQDKSASKKHQKAKREGETCIDCHKGIAHEEPDEPEDNESNSPSETKEKTKLSDDSSSKEQVSNPSKDTSKLADDVVAEKPVNIVSAPVVPEKVKGSSSDSDGGLNMPKGSMAESPIAKEKVTKPEEEITPPPTEVDAKTTKESIKNSTSQTPAQTETSITEETLPVANIKSTDATDAGPLTDLVNSCNKCHGKDGNSQDKSVPNISKASALYLHDALMAFKSGDRKGDEYKSSDSEVTDMNKVTADLTEDDFTALGEYYAGKSFVAHSQTADTTMAEAGAKIFDKKCEKCHAEGGTDPEDDAGILAGQPKDYLVKQFSYFDDESREMPKKMAKKFKKLTDIQKQQIIEFLIK